MWCSGDTRLQWPVAGGCQSRAAEKIGQGQPSRSPASVLSPAIMGSRGGAGAGAGQLATTRQLGPSGQRLVLTRSCCLKIVVCCRVEFSGPLDQVRWPAAGLGWAGLGGHSVLSPAVSILGPASSGHHLGARLRVLVTLLCNDSSFGNVINASGNGDIVAGCWLG